MTTSEKQAFKRHELKRKAAIYDRLLDFFEAGHWTADTFTFRQGKREVRVTLNKESKTFHVWED
jgi:hypothetical protein